MPHATIGVIGHVNHGKTSLVRALTGTDTDRLDEEKRRGMSIVLGFAWLALPGGTLDLVDVPGHEQFVRTMVSGATGVQGSLLVVNAREGVKPQTAEHVAIADLMGVRRGVVAITKADLVDAQERLQVQQDVRRFLHRTHLEFAPLVFTSVQTGEGLESLRQALGALAAAAAAAVPQAGGRHFFLPADRVFTLPGHGTIVTGTLRAGALRVGDAVACMPRGLAGTVRQLQVHNESVTEAWPGQRVGVNLRQLGSDEVVRGDVLAPPGKVQPGRLLDVELRMLAPFDVRALEGRRVRLLFGTQDVSAVVRLLEPARAGRTLAQLRAAAPVVAIAGEPFILRRESPAATLGGGRILDASPRRHSRGDPMALEHLRILAGGSARQRLEARIKTGGQRGCLRQDLATDARLSPELLAHALQEIAFEQGGRVWHFAVLEQAKQNILQTLGAFHRAQPLKAFAPSTVCRAHDRGTGAELLQHCALQLLEQEQRIVQRLGQARLAGHDPRQALDPRQREELKALDAAFRAGGMNPPDTPPESDRRRRTLLDLLVAEGDVLLLPGQPPTQRIAFHREALARARGTLLAAFPPPTAFTVSKARELLSSTRKFTVPLLQHLLASGDTERHGDDHVFTAACFRGGV